MFFFNTLPYFIYIIINKHWNSELDFKIVYFCTTKICNNDTMFRNGNSGLFGRS